MPDAARLYRRDGGLDLGGVERLGDDAIRARLQEVHRRPISYAATWRLVRRLSPPAPQTFVRIEVVPGSEAQVDFGYAGRTIDPRTGRLRKTWAFVLVLSWSRHLYAELVFDQRVET